ncbi:hypothetical protein [Limosilactobacillus gorillae]|jgi:hypothetical protein|uniref:hypothetical protein n=1 Tax=Limosilactobacillus gorillae TaxID=1450649 RepID=UPI000B095FF7|nr:hypothetical protein [Limosilactobacillus gorillae]
MDEHQEEMSRRRNRRQQSSAGQEPVTSGVQMTRQESLELAKKERQEAATKRLKRRLNWVIFGLIVAIIIVYLILFFVD